MMRRTLTILAATLAVAAIATPATAQATTSVTRPGKAGIVIRKEPGCTAQYYTSGPYRGQGLERCPAGRFERIEWRARGHWSGATIHYFGLRSCVLSVRLFTKDGVAHSQWRFGNANHGCSVRVKGVTFTH